MNNNNLSKKDLELIESVVYKSADDIAVSICRGLERLEERLDSTESRLYSRLAELDDKLCEIADDHKSLREVVTA